MTIALFSLGLIAAIAAGAVVVWQLYQPPSSDVIQLNPVDAIEAASSAETISQATPDPEPKSAQGTLANLAALEQEIIAPPANPAQPNATPDADPAAELATQSLSDELAQLPAPQPPELPLPTASLLDPESTGAGQERAADQTSVAQSDPSADPPLASAVVVIQAPTSGPSESAETPADPAPEAVSYTLDESEILSKNLIPLHCRSSAAAVLIR